MNGVFEYTFLKLRKFHKVVIFWFFLVKSRQFSTVNLSIKHLGYVFTKMFSTPCFKFSLEILFNSFHKIFLERGMSTITRQLSYGNDIFTSLVLQEWVKFVMIIFMSSFCGYCYMIPLLEKPFWSHCTIQGFGILITTQTLVLCLPLLVFTIMYWVMRHCNWNYLCSSCLHHGDKHFENPDIICLN